MPLRNFRVKKYKVGDLRVYHIANPPAEPKTYPVKSPEHAVLLIAALAESDLLDETIESNVFGLEVLEPDGEWCDWENEDGDTIDTVSRYSWKEILGKVK